LPVLVIKYDEKALKPAFHIKIKINPGPFKPDKPDIPQPIRPLISPWRW
jgi:hypothetical protein